MLHRVVKPFPYYEDGFTLVDLNAGDERDFGIFAAGLLAEGWIEAVDAVAESGGEPAVKPAKRAK